MKAGEPIVLKGEFVGSPYPTVTWLKASTKQPLEDEKRVKINTSKTNTELTIEPSIRLQDKGNYILKLENFLKTVEVEVCVEVLGESTVIFITF